MNILVTGANGQLGEEIKRKVKEIGNGHPDHDSSEANYYIFTDRDELDITDEKAVDKFVKENFVNVIVNCAAYTNVDKAQEDRDLAYSLNALGPLNLALAAKAVGAVLIQISTDYVFGGTYNTPLPPIVQTDPAFVPADRDKNFYGYSKMVGEDLIQQSGCKYLIFRTSWLYSSHHKNFVKTMYNLKKKGVSPKVVYDQVGSPTSAENLADFLIWIIESNTSETRYLSKQGVYNFANNGVASWYDLAMGVYGTNSAIVNPCRSEEYPSPVKRPNYSVLDVSLTEKTFDYDIHYWRFALNNVIYELELEEQ